MNLQGAVLLLVDLQQAFDGPPWGQGWNARLDENVAALLQVWRRQQRPLIHVRHDSVRSGSTLRPGGPGNAFRAAAAPWPGEPVISKSVNSAFIGTDLDLRLRRMQAASVVVCGISTDMCVSTTVRTGANLGWPMLLVEDACDCFTLRGRDGGVIPARTVHDVHTATLAAEFCTVVSTEALLAAALAGAVAVP